MPSSRTELALTLSDPLGSGSNFPPQMNNNLGTTPWSFAEGLT